MNDEIARYLEEDEATRRRIREALNETLFVEAGAGTGKTRALVDRIVALVLAQRPIERIVAITFTEKAAAELKDRVRGELELCLRREPEKAELIAAALASLDRAQISTIHAFGQALLRSFAAEAGVDPAFEVQDEVLADRRFEERWRMYLEALAADPAAVAAVDCVLGLGLTTRDLGDIARELSSKPHLISRLEESPLQASPPAWLPIQPLLDELEALPLGEAPPGDPLRERVETLLALVKAVAAAGGDRESLLASGAGVLGQKYGVSRQAAWGGKARIDRVRDTAIDVCAKLSDVLATCRAEALAQLLPYIVRFVAEDALVRGREGALTFDDLILRPRDLLLGGPAAARLLRERYGALLIDEFQDTDPLQVDIALAFATDPDTGAIDPGRLFLVGDPKQSIYRFRRADMAVYSRTRNLAGDHGAEFPVLSLSRRSRAPIIAWVNALFFRLIGDGGTPTIQPPYRSIHHLRQDGLKGPGVAWFGAEANDAVRNIRRTEAGEVAHRCQSAVVECWEIADREGAVRTAAFRDIAILIPTRAILPALERALTEAGVPYRVEGGSLIYRTQEIRDLINCLTAIDDPSDEVAVVAAIRSVAFACSDVDIARHKASGGSFNYLSRALDGRDGPVAEGLKALRRYHDSRYRFSLAALVQRFVAERGQVETGILDQGDRNSFRRMRFIAEQARKFEAAGPESLRAFVAWLERQTGQKMLDREGAGLDDDEDAVKVLTVHGAKGLEFPIVFLAGVSSGPINNRDIFGLDASGQIAVTVGAQSRSARFDIGPVETVRAAETAHSSAEFDRLLYVACTRARDHLVFSLYRKSGASGCAARRLIDNGAMDHAQPLPELAAIQPAPSVPFAGLEIDPPGMDTEEEWAAAREALLAGARARDYTSATALGHRAEAKDEARDETEPWARGRGGTRLGRSVHATIQSLPLNADESLIEPFSRAQAVAEAIPERWRDVAALVRRALQSEAAGRARAASRSLREVPFAARFGSLVLEGFVDLLLETPDSIEIIDWKTDDVPAEAIPARLREYELQAGLYGLGIEAATGRPVTRITYVFLRPGIEVSPGDPKELAEAARARLEDPSGVPRDSESLASAPQDG